MHVPVNLYRGAQDHFYSSKSIRLEVLIFNINKQCGLSGMDGHVFEDQSVEPALNKIKKILFRFKPFLFFFLTFSFVLFFICVPLMILTGDRRESQSLKRIARKDDEDIAYRFRFVLSRFYLLYPKRPK